MKGTITRAHGNNGYHTPPGCAQLAPLRMCCIVNLDCKFGSYATRLCATLEDAFGYTAFISLLAGIMTFSESTTHSGGYKIDFWCHNGKLQARLIKNFLGKTLSSTYTTDISNVYFQHMPESDYFTSIFLFGARRGDRLIKPSDGFFTNNYYRKLILLSATDYKTAVYRFNHRSFSQFLDPRKLDEMNLKGRLQIFNFLAPKLISALEKMTLPHEGLKDLFLKNLMDKIIYPTYDGNYYVLTLRNIFFKGSSDEITIKVKTGRTYLGASFEVTYDELIEKITPEQLFTMNFYWGDTIFPSTGYNLDFNLVWDDLAPKVERAYNILKEMLSDAPITNGLLKVDFYQRTYTGVKLLTEKSTALSTPFSQSEFYVNPKNSDDLETKVLSMIFWMMMEPNIIPVVKLPNGNIFLIMDLYQLYDERLDLDTLTLSGTYEFSPPSNYEQRQEQFLGVFDYSDIMSFLNFHNHELSDSHGDMISYVMAKFRNHYVSFLKGNKNSKLFDLR